MNKTILATSLILGTALTAAAAEKADQTGRATAAVAPQPIQVQTPFRVWPDGNFIFVVNGGTADWTAPLDVYALCTPVAPTTSCGPNFPGGTLHKHYDKGQFPKGHGQSPASAPNGNSVIVTYGAGYDAIPMGLPVGTYRVTVAAANNSSPATDIKITVPPPGSAPVLHANPAGTRAIAPRTP